ncbi:GntR family transcriptional regulator [Agromyces sp. GXQ0307]|uniref:GntR family transcriptional regulator n=1 Tax=Agromyces sp. GXQ0307 TaxID=3377835 RepID=UPI00383AF07E
MDESRPIFLQVAEQIENDIVDGHVAEDAAIPSINELAAFHRINPATALKGVNRLVEQGLVAKRRGVGMFVVPGARERLIERRRSEFAAEYLRPLIVEAAKLGIGVDELAAMVREERILT